MNFLQRHLGPRDSESKAMLAQLGAASFDALTAATVPGAIRMKGGLDLPAPLSEAEMLARLADLASRNQVAKSYLGMGYSGTITPNVILRNVLENPGWYTQYTPYQAEIAQGRLEALLNFQTLIIDLTGLPIANASLLDEATAAAEAMYLCAAAKQSRGKFLVDRRCHPQVIEVVRTRAEPLGIEVSLVDAWGERGRFAAAAAGDRGAFGVLLPYPCTEGEIRDPAPVIEAARAAGLLTVLDCDLLSLTLLKSPGELGADVAVGTTQRFGVPMGFGGPHAAFMSAREEMKRLLPGRIVGLSQDADGRPAARLALQTREQHIRRDKATSNICTAQVLLAVMASMYAVYHGPDGLREIAGAIHDRARRLAAAARRLGLKVAHESFFDTIVLDLGVARAASLVVQARAGGMNLRALADGARVGISLDEETSDADVARLERVLADFQGASAPARAGTEPARPGFGTLDRRSPFLAHPVFHEHRSETEMLRYLTRLQGKDLSLAHSMIPLGSCTMKLNATAEMIPVTWPEFGKLHPFAPAEQTLGYRELFRELERWLAAITGFDAISLQPNAGSQGEYAGLLAIRAYHRERGDLGRDVCLIPRSAHGTNPASAALAGMKVVVVECDGDGNVDLADLKRQAAAHHDRLAALMVTYPSTHGVFEEPIQEICAIIHAAGGQVYMDGANMNAQVGLCRPGDFGADVCHLNLHKTFCIPHGGGGPGMGPIGVKKHLAPFLPGHPLEKGVGGEKAIGAVSAAPWGSASILPISWAYIAMMGAEGLKRATEVAILNANYVAEKLAPHYPVLYRGKAGRVAHECIFDCRPFKESAGIEVEDIAKRLMDYGFHAPTVSFPVPGTMMVEPTESESRAELDRFCDAMIRIRAEIQEVADGKADRANNVLKRAPHTAEQVTADAWDRPYGRQKAAFPAPWVRDRKFWPSVARVNGVLGDRNLVCACPSVEEYRS